MSNAPLRGGDLDDLSGIVTEDDEPVDDVFSEKQQRLLTYPLLDCWTGPPPVDGESVPFLAMANVGLFFARGAPPLVPDALLSVGVAQLPDPFPTEGRSYFTWIYGQPPTVVIEIVSNDRGGELSDKLRKYERIGVPHYVVYDPERHLDSEPLHVFSTVGGRLHRQEIGTGDTDRAMFPDLRLTLTLWRGTFEKMEATWLRWAEPDGTLIATAADEHARAETEKQRAETEKQRADALAAQLRALGVEPD